MRKSEFAELLAKTRQFELVFIGGAQACKLSHIVALKLASFNATAKRGQTKSPATLIVFNIAHPCSGSSANTGRKKMLNINC
jgi:hypothetical protein